MRQCFHSQLWVGLDFIVTIYVMVSPTIIKSKARFIEFVTPPLVTVFLFHVITVIVIVNDLGAITTAFIRCLLKLQDY